MALPKSFRSGMGGSQSAYIITGSVLVGFFLIAIWVFSAPAAIPVQSQGGSVLNTNNDPSLKAPNTSTTEDDSWKERPLDPVTDVDGTKEPAEDQAPVNQGIHSTVAETQPKELPDQAELTTENKEVAETEFGTQAADSREEKEPPKDLHAAETSTSEAMLAEQEGKAHASTQTWKLCDFKNAQDFIPCLDNERPSRSSEHGSTTSTGSVSAIAKKCCPNACFHCRRATRFQSPGPRVEIRYG